MDNVIYSCRAPLEATRREAVIWMAALLILCALLCYIVTFLPFTGILRIFVTALFAVLIYSMMKLSLFDITYVLYSDRLVFLRRFGYLTKENEVFPISEAKFFDDHIEYLEKSYPFHPDERLKELLKIK